MNRIIIGWALLVLLCAALAVLAGNIGLRRVEHSRAAQCAAAAAAMGEEVVECYHQYGLETPEADHEHR